MRVTGIDPAEVDPEVLAHERFTHIRARTMAVPRRLFREIDWLAADINAAPTYTLDAVEAIVTHREAHLRGMLLTLKLLEWELATPELLSAYVDRIQSWGYQDVRLRQLAHNRREICAVALRSRGQRRRVRSQGKAETIRRFNRRDEAHSELGGPHR
jgi:23S rRNA (cytidine2498-2'-O)-methyltransferase